MKFREIEKQGALGLFELLVTACDDHELDTLLRVAERAGVVWRCTSKGEFSVCGTTNDYDAEECGDCGSPREVAR